MDRLQHTAFENWHLEPIGKSSGNTTDGPFFVKSWLPIPKRFHYVSERYHIPSPFRYGIQHNGQIRNPGLSSNQTEGRWNVQDIRW